MDPTQDLARNLDAIKARLRRSEELLNSFTIKAFFQYLDLYYSPVRDRWRICVVRDECLIPATDAPVAKVVVAGEQLLEFQDAYIAHLNQLALRASKVV